MATKPKTTIPTNFSDFFRPDEPFGVRVALSAMTPEKRDELYAMAGLTLRQRAAIQLFVFSVEMPDDVYKADKKAAAPDPGFAAVIRKRLKLDERGTDPVKVEEQVKTFLACSDERLALPEDRRMLTALRVSFVIGMERLIQFMNEFAKK